jgi:peptide/nickel transport system substrate-binding protein
MIARRTLLASAAALPFLRREARGATTAGRLVFGLSAYPPSLAPWANAGTAAATAKLAMHRGLLGYAPDGSLRGELAESWEHAADGAWVFHLRDATFHNGDPVTSADVAWTVEQVAGEKSSAYLRAEMQGLARVETPDPKTVRFVTASPNAAFPYLAASYFLPIIAKGTTDVGAGPFVPSAQERGVAIEFEAYPKYYRAGMPRLKTIRMVAYADENLRVAALQSGDVDLIEYVPWQSMGSIETNAALSLQATEGPFMYLMFNGHAGPFADARVRQAVALSIRREDIVKAAFFGRGSPLAGVPIRPDSPFYDAKLANGWATDLDRAKSLLAAAGLPNGFSCKLLGTSTYGMHKDTAAVMQQHWAAVGIQVELVMPDWATRVALGNRGQYEMSLNGTTADSNDPDGLASLLATNLSPSYVRSVGLSIPKLDSLLAAGRTEFDPAKRKAIYDDVQRVTLEEVPMAGLAWRSQGYGLSRSVHDFQNLPGALTFYSGTTLEQVSTG